jgi:hypothetical protein
MCKVIESAYAIRRSRFVCGRQAKKRSLYAAKRLIFFPDFPVDAARTTIFPKVPDDYPVLASQNDGELERLWLLDNWSKWAACAAKRIEMRIDAFDCRRKESLNHSTL